MEFSVLPSESHRTKLAQLFGHVCVPLVKHMKSKGYRHRSSVGQEAIRPGGGSWLKSRFRT